MLFIIIKLCQVFTLILLCDQIHSEFLKTYLINYRVSDTVGEIYFMIFFNAARVLGLYYQFRKIQW